MLSDRFKAAGLLTILLPTAWNELPPERELPADGAFCSWFELSLSEFRACAWFAAAFILI